MEFQTPLLRATLQRRYKRFLADVTLEDGQEVTVHCANPGAMLGVSTPGATVWVEPSQNPKRKLKYSWRLIALDGGHLAGIDTSVPNKVVGEALRAGDIGAVSAYTTVRPEVKYAQSSRVDFLLTEPGRPDCYLEVKNVHLRREGTWAEFPDCVTARGAKHLADLSLMVAQGHRATMLYLIQRTDCTALRFAADLDPKYATAARAAKDAGVEMLCYDTRIDSKGIWLGRPCPVALTG
ncbi:MAG: DNA/RNA nuclease SfsA [Pseudomonadota bacterium]